MARRRNIFDFASKELSATAFWAWILDSEHSADASLRAINADLRLKLGVPSEAVLQSIELEKNPDDPGLKLQTPSETEERTDRKRIDILATYRMAEESLLRLVIENKVRRDPNVIRQVTEYRDRLQSRVAGPVRAAVFTFDDALASSALSVDESITILALSEMAAIVDKHAASNAILDAYSAFLMDKLTVASATPVRGSGGDYPENLARWAVVADQRGIQPLLERYVTCAEQFGFTINHSKGRSIFLTLGTASPVVSVHPLKTSLGSGLWLGISLTNLSRAYSVCLSRADMPTDFAWRIEKQGGNEWRFGYIGIDQIEPTLRMISEFRPG